jgi:hypothetical protein
MLRIITDLINRIPGDPDFDDEVEAYFSRIKPFKTRKMMAIKDAFVILQYTDPKNSLVCTPVCVCTSWSAADLLCAKCIEYNKTAPIPPENSAADAWEDHGNAMDAWRENHPLRFYNKTCKVKTTDYYVFNTVPVQF